MPTPLSIEDFKFSRAVCEIRYEDSYLIFDRTGALIRQVQRTFTNVQVRSASPNESTFSSDQGVFAFEVGQSRFTSDKPDNSLEVFAANSRKYFDAVTDCLEVEVFKRIGLRVFMRKDFKDIDDAEAALASIGLLALEPKKRFGASGRVNEILLRWEGGDIGALLRLKAEKGTIDLVLPPEFEVPEPSLHRSIIGLLVDVDFYTVAPVEKAQWDPVSWIPQSIRTIRREVDDILSR